MARYEGRHRNASSPAPGPTGSTRPQPGHHADRHADRERVDAPQTARAESADRTARVDRVQPERPTPQRAERPERPARVERPLHEWARAERPAPTARLTRPDASRPDAPRRDGAQPAAPRREAPVRPEPRERSTDDRTRRHSALGADASAPLRRGSTPAVPSPAAAVSEDTQVLTRRRDHKPAKRTRRVGRPVLAGALALGLGASGFAYARSANLIGADPAAFVVGSGVVAQTDELARASTVDTTYRAAASVSRNERRTAIAATGLRDAAALEVKKKKEKARAAAEAKAAAEQAALEKERQRAIGNAIDDPKSAARVLMADYGWTSDAQYNCLVNLWTGESGWRYTAENPSSGAYGIPQSLPGRKMAQMGGDWRTNPLTQIKWGLWYIDMSYGNPCNAWSTWQARSPHWY
ncbi:lytic transglycosylase domain-containing protein [Intrasporangium sp. YIM S08009]|uniref:aggregation-promoting factor C-terminal-like domain-containing protein n=1 Tax=Intrasporangium zincisolvens TaxID=3080018 RepID=UPI002B0555CB|nr:lytic transglycosylase domain-containing protein [Intrasporangium sp. YIM S08009]